MHDVIFRARQSPHLQAAHARGLTSPGNHGPSKFQLLVGVGKSSVVGGSSAAESRGSKKLEDSFEDDQSQNRESGSAENLDSSSHEENPRTHAGSGIIPCNV